MGAAERRPSSRHRDARHEGRRSSSSPRSWGWSWSRSTGCTACRRRSTAFLRLDDTLLASRSCRDRRWQHIEPELGVSHAGSAAGPVAPGAMQHVALNVDSEADLLALRDRLRSNGYWVMGPIDHGMCKSMYLVGARGHRARVRDLGRADRRRPVDRSRGRRSCAASIAAELARYRQPAPFRDRATAGSPNPDHRTRVPALARSRPGWRPIFAMSDEAIAETHQLPDRRPFRGPIRRGRGFLAALPTRRAVVV